MLLIFYCAGAKNMAFSEEKAIVAFYKLWLSRYTQATPRYRIQRFTGA